MQIAEQKSLLAKLMATENIYVEHRKIDTAKFDPENRVMYLPIWEDMDGIMYDLLAGHEVGHALYTPAEGWHDVVVDKEKPKSYKNFLNVVEDARIEKKVQRKYPGLRKSFREAYIELMKRDFFGIRYADINTLPFIDRLNIFTKSQYSMQIEFSDEEQSFIEQVKCLETWEDVLRLTEAIFKYSQQEQKDHEEKISLNDDGEESDGSDDAEYDDYDDYDLEEKEESFDDEENEIESDDRRRNVKDSRESTEDQFSLDRDEPVCRTDESYRRNESKLVANTSSKYVYLSYPKPIMKNVLTPWKRVQHILSDFYDKNYSDETSVETKRKLVSDFKNRNERFISLLVKEFEMRKAAKAYVNRKVSDSGEIDIDKLSGYKFDDNIFRKLMTIPKGKSHGLMLLLDYSGSMSDNIAGSIEQVLILSMFCRKVNIPFVMYTFTDNYNVAFIDREIQSYADDEGLLNSFEKTKSALTLSNVRLREYLSSEMTNSEFAKALQNMLCLKYSFEGNLCRPNTEQLSNTPTTQALVAAAPLMREFKAKYNLDISNLVIVQDGDSDSNNGYLDENGVPSTLNSYSKDRIIIQDKQFKYQDNFVFSFNSDIDQLFVSTLKWFSAVTDSKVFGFFIISPYYAKSVLREKYYVDEKTPWKFSTGSFEQVHKQFRTEKCLVSKNPGYSAFFMISGGDELKTESDELKINGDITTGKLKTAFSKMSKKKVMNRVLVTKFIEGIAK